MDNPCSGLVFLGFSALREKVMHDSSANGRGVRLGQGAEDVLMMILGWGGGGGGI